MFGGLEQPDKPSSCPLTPCSLGPAGSTTVAEASQSTRAQASTHLQSRPFGYRWGGQFEFAVLQYPRALTRMGLGGRSQFRCIN